MIDIEPIVLVYAGCVGVGLAALDTLSHEFTLTRSTLYAGFGAALALSGFGDEALATAIAFAITRAASHKSGGDTRTRAKLLAGLSVLFFALVGSGPFPWEDPRTWVWPIAALLVRAGLPGRSALSARRVPQGDAA